ncbi:unnamed protein product [Owenia fusiformis]|uniref:Uncharacterized protein n=1 Tax=Owenia fusiformis TaxID=6347 RepID=A0A8S4Q7K3_OWEFU|nr:unnamed protein product [Owenia fusiformis]
MLCNIPLKTGEVLSVGAAESQERKLRAQGVEFLYIPPLTISASFGYRVSEQAHWTIQQNHKSLAHFLSQRVGYETLHKFDWTIRLRNISLSARQRLSAVVYSQCFSPCGKFLATGNNYGHISIYSLPAALSPSASEATWKAILTFKAHPVEIFALVSTEQFIISAGSGAIKAWKWSDIHSKTLRVVWSLEIPQSVTDNPETNALVVDEQEGSSSLYAGCGDNNLYQWDMNTGDLLRTFQGHQDYVHCLAKRNDSEIISGSEDGTVRIWDTRTEECVHRLEPHKIEQCSRLQFGKWISCVAVDDNSDWMVCGGGPALSLWHLRSLSSSTTFHAPKVCSQFAMFYEDTVISGGNEPYVSHWMISGEQKQHVPCSPTSVYNVAINEKSNNYKVLAVAGSSQKVDICTNFNYKALSLTC